MGFINGHDKSGHLHQKPGQMMLDSGGQDLHWQMSEHKRSGFERSGLPCGSLDKKLSREKRKERSFSGGFGSVSIIFFRSPSSNEETKRMWMEVVIWMRQAKPSE
jgi:hypothetical protein